MKKASTRGVDVNSLHVRQGCKREVLMVIAQYCEDEYCPGRRNEREYGEVIWIVELVRLRPREINEPRTV